MKDLFKNASSSWVRYSRYEWRKDKNNKYYITPAPDAMPRIYDPLKEYQQMVLDALNVGLMIRQSTKRKIREAIMDFVSRYGLLGLMTALPTTPTFIDYKAVYFLTNHFIREEVLDTETYLGYFFPFEKLDFRKKGKESMWFIQNDRTMIALAMTFQKEPQAQVMCFMRNYAERFDWLEQVFQDWSFTFLSSFLFYEDAENLDEDTRDIYRQGMAAFGGIAPSYHVELRDRPTIVWDYHSLLLAIQMMFSFMLADETSHLTLCRNCMKAFFTSEDTQDCCTDLKNELSAMAQSSKFRSNRIGLQDAISSTNPTRYR